MGKDFRLEGRICFSKKPFGIGCILELHPPFAMYPVYWVLKIDLIFIRFWIENRSLNINS